MGWDPQSLIGEDLFVDSGVLSAGRGLHGSLGRTGLGFFGSEMALRWPLNGACTRGVETGSGGGGSGGMKVFSR